MLLPFAGGPRSCVGWEARPGNAWQAFRASRGLSHLATRDCYIASAPRTGARGRTLRIRRRRAATVGAAGNVFCGPLSAYGWVRAGDTADKALDGLAYSALCGGQARPAAVTLLLITDFDDAAKRA